MTTVQAVAIRWADDAFPGWVEVVLMDASGRARHLLDKAPVFGDERLTPDADYPFDVRLDCDVLRAEREGAALVALRHGVEAEDGTATFLVPRNRLFAS